MLPNKNERRWKGKKDDDKRLVALNAICYLRRLTLKATIFTWKFARLLFIPEFVKAFSLWWSRLALRQKRGDMSYEECCDTLHWPSLSSRRTYSSLVECYKIVFGLSQLDFEEFFQFAKVKSTRANHSYKLYCKLSRINCFKYSFFNNVISYWNNLPSNVVEAGTLELFKCKLKSFLKL